MTRTIFAVPAVLFITLAIHSSASGQTQSSISGNDAVAVDIKVLLNRYVLAVNSADSGSLRLLWANPDQTSFVSPIQRFTTSSRRAATQALLSPI